ncbi:hypothetical protein LguiA_019658 [Lonicera macranthoides]
MSEASKGDLDTLTEENKVIPDYFGYYTREVADLFLQDDDFVSYSSKNFELAGRTYEAVGEKDRTKQNYSSKDVNSFTGSDSLFNDAVGAGLSDIRKERLKAFLRQSVVSLTGEVDEMVDPVIEIRRIQYYLRNKTSLLNKNLGGGATYESDAAGQPPQKKLKLCSSSSSVSLQVDATSPISCSRSGESSGNENMDVTVPGKGSIGVKQCSNCLTIIETSKWRTGSDGGHGAKSLCNACGIKFKQAKESLLINDQRSEPFTASNIGAENVDGEINEDLQFLLENNSSKVEETMKKYSDELSTVLGYMERKLEELLDIVMSSCRSMTLAEKHQLQRMIQNLPPRNLDQVVEIIRCSRKPSKKNSCDEIHVDLEDEDNATLWRLYYYAETVENARKLCVGWPDPSLRMH